MLKKNIKTLIFRQFNFRPFGQQTPIQPFSNYGAFGSNQQQSIYNNNIPLEIIHGRQINRDEFPQAAGVTSFQNEDVRNEREISSMMDETKANSELPKFLHAASKEIIDQVSQFFTNIFFSIKELFIHQIAVTPHKLMKLKI